MARGRGASAPGRCESPARARAPRRSGVRAQPRQKSIVASSRASASSRDGKTSGSAWLALRTSSAREPLEAANSPLIASASQTAAPGVPGADGNCVGTGARDGHAAARVDPRRARRVAEAWLEPPAHRHLTGEALHPSHQLARRSETAARQRHRVGHANAALVGDEGRLQHVRIRQVAPLRAEGDGRREHHAAAPFLVEKGAEHAWRVEVRQAEPVDRSVVGDEGGRTTVADHAVVANRWLLVSQSLRSFHSRLAFHVAEGVWLAYVWLASVRLVSLRGSLDGAARAPTPFEAVPYDR